MLLALAMILGLAACGGTQQADVVENVDPENNSVVIETPPAIVSGPDTTPAENYPPVNVLPTTVPTTDPNPAVTIAPTPSTAPESGNGNGNNASDNTGSTTPSGSADNDDDFEYADDTGLGYNPTATNEEKNNAWIGYTNVDWANFRVGPGTEYKIYESLPKGSQVKVLGYTNNGWAKVWYNDYLIGYIASNFISSKAPEASVVITPTETPAPTAAPEPSVIIITP